MSIFNWKVAVLVGLLFFIVLSSLQRATQAQITLTFLKTDSVNIKSTAVNWVLRWNSSSQIGGRYISIVEGHDTYRINLSEHFQDIGLSLKTGIVWASVLSVDGDAISGILISWTTPAGSGSEVTSVDGPILIPIE